MDSMVRQLVKFAIVLIIGVSPIAHELCQLSCESAAPAETTAAVTAPSSPHAHCAEAAGTTSSGHSSVLVRAAAACRSASDLQDTATLVAKAIVHPLLPVAAAAFDAPVLARDHRLGGDEQHRPAAFVSSLIPLRV
jgi:hypothetical protein